MTPPVLEGGEQQISVTVTGTIELNPAGTVPAVETAAPAASTDGEKTAD